MFILKEAWGSIARHKVLSVVSVTTTVVVTAATLMGLAIVQADTNAQTTTYNAQKVNAIISLDKAKIEKANKTKNVDWSKYELSWEKYSTYAEAAGVTINAYYYETADAKLSGDTKTVSGTSDTKSSAERGQISIVSTSSKAATASLPDSGFTLVSGKTVDYTGTTISNKAVVSQSFAKANDYKVGSKFKLVNPSNAKKTIEMTVSGIYKDHASSSKLSTKYSDASNANNAIYVSSYTFMGNGFYSATKPGSIGHVLRIVFELSSPKDYNTFVKKSRAAGLGSNYIISSPTLAQYQAKVAPLTTLAKVMKVTVIAIGAIGAIVLLVCLILSWKRRNEDIGMLVGIGVGRARISWRYSVELLMITIPGAIVGFGIGVGLSFAIAGVLPASGIVRATPDMTLMKYVAIGGVALWALCIIAAIVRVASFRMNTLLGPATYESVADHEVADGEDTDHESAIEDDEPTESEDKNNEDKNSEDNHAATTGTHKEGVSA
ncbi:MAG: ABC transporter permease [Bifidobacterium sp.]